MKKLIFTTIALLAMSAASFAQTGLVYHSCQIVDELGRPVTTISSVTVRLSGTTTAATIYMDSGKANAITQPITTTSDNTTLSNGAFYWYGPDGWDYTITDGTNIHTNYGHVALTASNGRIVFPSYLQSLSSLTYTDAQSATFGTDSDFVLNGGGTADTLNLTSANLLEAAYFNIGADTSGIDLKVFGTTSGDYWSWDASADLFTIVGDAVAWTLTEPAATAVNIDITGAGGGFDLDTTDGPVDLTAAGATLGKMTLTVGDEFALASVDTIDIDSSAGDVTIAANAAEKNVTIDSVLGSVLITATENLADAVLVTADGGTAATIKIHNDTGNVSTANAASIQLTSDIGAINLVATANVAVAEGASAIQLTATAGGIELLSKLAGDNAIKLTADGGATAEIDIYNDAGTTADSIGLLSDEGGITLATTLGANAITGVGGHSITATATADDTPSLTVSGAITGGTKCQGSAIYASTACTGSIDGTTYNLGSWLDITDGTPTSAALFVGIEAGVYVSATPPMTAADIAVLQVQYQGNSSSTCDIVSMMRFNSLLAASGGEAPDYFIWAGNDESICFTGDAATGATKVGAIKINSAQSGTMYIWTYDSTGA